MTALYVDASAVLKIVLGQPGVRAPMGRDSIVISSEVLRIETARALDRMRITGSLTDEAHLAKLASADSLLDTFHLIPLADELVDGAREKYPFEVSTLCSIHVATARAISREVEHLQFWTHLPQQALAAISRGLDVRGSVIKS